MTDNYDDINVIHYNDFGVAFNWKGSTIFSKNKIQLVFKNTGLLLSRQQLFTFKSDIEYVAINRCNCSEKSKNLTPSPCEYISFAMSNSELNGLMDLLNGVCFNIQLLDMLKKII